MSSVNFSKDIPIKYEVDVFVAGGGPAGCAAAITAARAGISVFIAEAEGCFGGMGTAGLVPAFMAFGDGDNFLSAGFGEEVLDRLLSINGAGFDEGSEKRNRNSACYAIEVEKLKKVYDEMMTETGVKFSFCTRLVDVKQSNGKVEYVVLAAKSGMFAVKAKTYIDCTGDGDLCVWAGADFEMGDECGNVQASTLCSLWAGLDYINNPPPPAGTQNSKVEQAFKDGVFSVLDTHVPGIWRITKRVGGGNIGHLYGIDGTDEVSLTEAFIKGRKLVREYEKYYREYMKGPYQNAELVGTASLVGVRESRRIVCEEKLDVSAFQTRAVFKNEIGRYNYWIDLHISNAGDEETSVEIKKNIGSSFLGRGESYGVPYGCIVPKKLDNVWVAGRCICTDRYMQGSMRVMPGCYITGQAAGLAAAISCIDNVCARDVDTDKLRNRLKSIGAYLP